MGHVEVTMVPDIYLDASCEELQGTVFEISYSVGNYIGLSRQLVTNHSIDSVEAGRKTVNGDAIKKKCCVYLPKGYNKNNSDEKYNVLYLLHGVGGNRFEWLSAEENTGGNAAICNIFDHLIANGDIDPMIIVFPEGRSAYDWKDRSFNTKGTNLLGFYYFDYELRYDLIPFIESSFHTIANIKDTSPEGIALSRKHRAIGGLSMGGMQTLNMVIGGYRCDSTEYTGTLSGWENGLDATVPAPGMLDLFAYAGAFSNAPTSSDGRVLGESIASCGNKLELLYMTCGSEDEIAYNVGYLKAADGLAEYAGKKLGDFYRVVVKDGKHDFFVWYNGAYNFARLSFGKGDARPWLNSVNITLC